MNIKLVSIIICTCTSLCIISYAPVEASSASSEYACTSKNGLPVKFDNNTHECTANGVVQRPIVLMSTAKTDLAHSAPRATTQATLIPTSTVVEILDKFKCGAVPHTGRSTGYECCGYGKYHPDFETCCVQMGNNFKVYTGRRRHKDYVCCGLDVHSRSSIIPCLHLARNDLLCNTKLKFKKKYKAKKYCSSDKHEYLMTVGAKDEQPNFQFYNANLTEFDNYGNSTGTRQVKVAIDKYSPKRKLTGKLFFIISENIYENDFILGLNDIVMKLPSKMITFNNRLKEVKTECRK